MLPSSSSLTCRPLPSWLGRFQLCFKVFWRRDASVKTRKILRESKGKRARELRQQVKVGAEGVLLQVWFVRSSPGSLIREQAANWAARTSQTLQQDSITTTALPGSIYHNSRHFKIYIYQLFHPHFCVMFMCYLCIIINVCPWTFYPSFYHVPVASETLKYWAVVCLLYCINPFISTWRKNTRGSGRLRRLHRKISTLRFQQTASKAPVTLLLNAPQIWR